MTLKIQSKQQYQQLLQLADSDNDQFWQDIADRYHWFENFSNVKSIDLQNKKPKISWFEDGKTNITYNCLDYNIEYNNIGDQVAIIEEGNDLDQPSSRVTYKQLLARVNQFANLLKAKGVVAGDRVCIYMPMTASAAVAMLACARIGAIHCVVFAGFSANALASRINDCQAKVVVTADILYRGAKELELAKIVQEATTQCQSIANIIIDQRLKQSPNLKFTNSNSQEVPTLNWQQQVASQSEICQPYHANSEDGLFILYTSGSTGKPKGIYHTTAGYMVYAGYSFANVFDYQKGDVFFCSADVGWITGHSYLVYGPLLNGAKTLMFEGVPNYPDPSRFFQVIDKHQVNIFYTAPTAIRALMQKDDKYTQNHNLSSLKTLGTVGEPINEEAYQWYQQKFGNNKCQIVDTWWQTETGGIMISALSGLTTSKPAFAGQPLPGIMPQIVNDNGQEVTASDQVGNLCISKPWPSMIRGVWGDDKKYYDTYFADFKGKYFSSDGAFVDQDGLFRIVGRIDDVINVSGHRLGTAEIENVINKNDNVSESAVIGYPHQIKGEGICAFVIKKQSANINDQDLTDIIQQNIRAEIGAIAKADKIIIVADLPKTRSGKIMRRILKKICAGSDDFADTTTLVNPDCIKQIQQLF